MMTTIEIKETFANVMEELVFVTFYDNRFYSEFLN